MDGRCGHIWRADGGTFVDGPYFYIDDRTMHVTTHFLMPGTRPPPRLPEEVEACNRGGPKAWESIYDRLADLHEADAHAPETAAKRSDETGGAVITARQNGA